MKFNFLPIIYFLMCFMISISFLMIFTKEQNPLLCLKLSLIISTMVVIVVSLIRKLTQPK